MINTFFYVQRKVKDAWFETRMLWQRLTRHDHICDCDIWGMNSAFIKKMYPLVNRFVSSKWRHGYHVLEQFWTKDGMGVTNDKAAQKAWEKVLQDILFAFEFYYQEEFENRTAKHLRAKLMRKYGDWHMKDLRYATIVGEQEITGSWVTSYSKLTKKHKTLLEIKYGKDWLKKLDLFYYNVKLHIKLSKKAHEGMKLFGEHAMGMWD